MEMLLSISFENPMNLHRYKAILITRGDVNPFENPMNLHRYKADGLNGYRISMFKNPMNLHNEMIEGVTMANKVKEKTRMTITRRVQLVPVGDEEEFNRVYTELREGMIHQNQAMNQYISALYVGMQNNILEEDRKELYHLFTRISSNKKGSAYSDDVKFFKGLGTTAQIGQKVKNDFSNAMKKGLSYGVISLPTYKKTNPLLVDKKFIEPKYLHKGNLGMYHPYSDHNEFLEHLNKNDLNIFIKFANGIIFKVIFGSLSKSAELRSVFKNIFEEYYSVQSSSIGIKKNKIFLNMSLSIPIKKNELDENTVVGVDLGLAVPAYCALNNSTYRRKAIGSAMEVVSGRTKIQTQRKRIQSNLKTCNGGHGRKKKLKKLEMFKEYERNWVKNINHKISSEIIKFAVKNKAKYINLEDLSGFGNEDDNKKYVLRNWSYYQLQSFIEYKAKREGIIVRYVEAAYTSQTCSCCGETNSENREDQATFICKNPKCENYNVKVNADFNAARNISMSENFVDRTEKKSKAKKQKETSELVA